jgi:hypothetical protein
LITLAAIADADMLSLIMIYAIDISLFRHILPLALFIIHCLADTPFSLDIDFSFQLSKIVSPLLFELIVIFTAADDYAAIASAITPLMILAFDS